MYMGLFGIVLYLLCDNLVFVIIDVCVCVLDVLYIDFVDGLLFGEDGWLYVYWLLLYINLVMG